MRKLTRDEGSPPYEATESTGGWSCCAKRSFKQGKEAICRTLSAVGMLVLSEGCEDEPQELDYIHSLNEVLAGSQRELAQLCLSPPPNPLGETIDTSSFDAL